MSCTLQWPSGDARARGALARSWAVGEVEQPWCPPGACLWCPCCGGTWLQPALWGHACPLKHFPSFLVAKDCKHSS